MIVAVLGIIDVAAGIVLALGGMPVLHGNFLVLVLGAILLGKGIYSWTAAVTKNFHLDLPGILDIAGGLMLIAVSQGFFLFFFTYIGIIEIIKGAYSFMTGCIR